MRARTLIDPSFVAVAAGGGGGGTPKCSRPFYFIQNSFAEGTSYTMWLDSTTSGVSIYYRIGGLDGDPIDTLFTGAFTLGSNQPLTSIAKKDGWLDSDITSYQVVSPDGDTGGYSGFPQDHPSGY